MQRRLGTRDYARYRIAARKAGDEVFANGDVRAEFRASMYAADKAESRRRKITALCGGGLMLLLAGAVSGIVFVF